LGALESFGEQLIEKFYDRIHCYVRMRVKPQDCEDVVGDIFLRAIQKQADLRGDAGGWLFSIARSQVVEHYRKRGMVMRTESPQSSSTAVDDQPASSKRSPAPLETLEQAEFRERLQQKMELLPEMERDVIAFKFTDGLSNTEIAQVLGITPNYLGVVLHRALQKLRSSMLEEVRA
jgi:RNA polymerase sigma-70 factor (ECF subfamily)